MPTASQDNAVLLTRSHRRRRWIAWTLVAALLILLCLLRWSSYLLVASDPLPARVDAAVVLQGSIAGENARIAGAMLLLQQGSAERMLLSVPHFSFWDEPIPPMARRYLERKYGGDLASRVDFCETGPEVNSTEDEARALVLCVKQHSWQNVAIVTSDYHTRRAGILWRKVLRQEDPAAHIWIHGVPDPEFNAKYWWHKRLYAKTCSLELLKLIWTKLAG